MPIYEYVCKACGFEKDVLQKMSEVPLAECPSCQKPEFSKLISAPGFRLKGSGWYETDFKTGKKKNLAGDNAVGDSKSGSAASTSDSTGSTSSSKESSSPTKTP